MTAPTIAPARVHAYASLSAAAATVPVDARFVGIVPKVSYAEAEAAMTRIAGAAGFELIAAESEHGNIYVFITTPTTPASPAGATV